MTRLIGMSAISGNALSINAGTKKMCDTSQPRIISANSRAVIVCMLDSSPWREIWYIVPRLRMRSS